MTDDKIRGAANEQITEEMIKKSVVTSEGSYYYLMCPVRASFLWKRAAFGLAKRKKTVLPF